MVLVAVSCMSVVAIACLAGICSLILQRHEVYNMYLNILDHTSSRLLTNHLSNGSAMHGKQCAKRSVDLTEVISNTSWLTCTVQLVLGEGYVLKR